MADWVDVVSVVGGVLVVKFLGTGAGSSHSLLLASVAHDVRLSFWPFPRTILAVVVQCRSIFVIHARCERIHRHQLPLLRVAHAVDPASSLLVDGRLH